MGTVVGKHNSKSHDEIFSTIEKYLHENDFEGAIQFISDKLDTHNSGELYCKLQIFAAHVYSYLGQLDFCIDAAEAAIQEAKDIGNKLFQVKGMIELIYAKWMVGALKEAYGIIIDAETILDSLPMSQSIEITFADIYNTRGIIADFMGDLQESLTYFDKSLVIRRKLNQTEDIAVSLNNIAIIYQNLGKMSKAKECLQESIEIKKKIGNKLDIANAISNLALHHRRNGNYAKAIELIEDCIQIFLEHGNVFAQSNAYLNLILFNYASGNYDQSVQHFEKLTTLIHHNDLDNSSILLNFDIAKGLIAYIREDYSDAVAIYTDIINREIIDHTLYIFAVQYLIEIKLIQIKKGTPIQELIDEIQSYIEILSNISHKQQMFPLYVATLIFKSKLMVLSIHFEDARILLYQALRIAEKHDFTELKSEILQEIDYIDEIFHSNEYVENDNLDHYIDLIKDITDN